MIIPIGVDCGAANFCKKYNLRKISLPFDWTVTYNGVSKCIENEFASFTEPLHNRINMYDIYFHHDFYNMLLINEEKEKYNRRCQRLIDILKTSSEDIIFFRKGHAVHQHYEHNGKYSNITNDLKDSENLDLILSKKYPQLRYKIIVILICGTCFKPNEKYTSDSNNIQIYNISTPVVDDTLFEMCCRNIFNV
jgi:hypothetical protein